MGARKENKNEKPVVFISHGSEDEELVNTFMNWLEAKYSGEIDFFSTSRAEEIGGKNFFKEIEEKIGKARVILLFLTSKSINKKWLYFEAGGGYFRGIPVIPVCYKDVSSRYLPFPLFMLHSYQLNNIEGFRALLKCISRNVDTGKPRVGMEEYREFCKSLGLEVGETINSKEVKTIFKFCKKLFAEDSQEDIQLGMRLLSAIQTDEALELAAAQLFSPHANIRKLARKIVFDISSPNTIKILMEKIKKVPGSQKVESEVYKLIKDFSTPNDIETIDTFMKAIDNEGVKKALANIKKGIEKKFETYYSGWRDELDEYYLKIHAKDEEE